MRACRVFPVAGDRLVVDPDRAGDSDWTPLFNPATLQYGTAPLNPPLSTPPFPDHPAHGCASVAIVHSMQSFLGTDKVPFSAYSEASR